MERTIINADINKNTIFSTEVEKLIGSEGIILVYEKDTLLGTVIFYNNLWIISTIYLQVEYHTFSKLIDDNNEFTFKYID